MLRLILLAAVGLPLMWANQHPPQPAFYSQALACGLWASVVAANALQRNNNEACVRAAPRSVPALWGLLLLTVAWHWIAGATPSFLLLPIALNLSLAGLISWQVVARDDAKQLQLQLTWLLVGVLIAAAVNAVAVLMQVFAPQWTDDVFFAISAAQGERAGGNLRQPNQLATLMVWGIVAATYLLWSRRTLWLACCVSLTLVLLASGSRTGLIGLLVLLPVGLISLRTRNAGSRHTGRLRALLWSSAWLLAGAGLVWAAAQVFGRDTAEASLAQRLALWQQTLTLIQQYPWTGVGWSQLNFVWTLTPFAKRAPDVFDHSHNLPLHLAVELGIPVTLGVIALLLAALWRPRAWRNALRGPNRDTLLTAACLLVAVGLHSLIEYPLWFSYFLLPTAFLLALLARLLFISKATASSFVTSDTSESQRVSARRCWPLAAGGIMAAVATLWGVREYDKASAIHYSGRDRAVQARAVETARASPLYGQYGDYAAIMLAGDRAPLEWFARPIRNVLDERLLTAWARALQRAGEHERAAWVIARAREFPPDAAFAGLPQVTAPLNPASAPRSAADFRR